MTATAPAPPYDYVAAVTPLRERLTGELIEAIRKVESPAERVDMIAVAAAKFGRDDPTRLTLLDEAAEIALTLTETRMRIGAIERVLGAIAR